MSSGLWALRDMFFNVRKDKDEATLRAEAAEERVAALEAELAEAKTKAEAADAARATETAELKNKVRG